MSIDVVNWTKVVEDATRRAHESLSGTGCDTCFGRGWYDQCQNPDESDPFLLEFREAYCDCAAGQRLRDREATK